ncbi:MAG: B12-binding domain-containing radical SAM protein [Bacteroidales bacterium]|nr:B12-binding domain-containing radical SAM protein [Bacteroidales bacterium]
MRITMIKPNIGLLQLKNGKDLPFNDKGRMEPLQLGVLAGLTPDRHEVTLIDDRINLLDYDTDTDLVAVTVEIYMAKRAYEIGTGFRNRGVPVVFGGIHASMMPEEAGQYADSVIIGDAEAVWEQVLTDAENKKLKKEYHSFPSVPHPGKIARRSIYQGKKYLPLTLLQYGRGCPYACSFCCISVYFDKKRFHRDIGEVLAEIKAQPRRLLFFVDDNIIGDKELAKKLFRELIPLKLKWVGQASLDMTQDPELMRLMQQSGCIGLVIGFESYSEKGLAEFNKTPNDLREFDRQIRIIRNHRINIWAAFVLGHDEETKETLRKTLEFTIRQGFAFVAFNILMPYPKTEIYARLQKENRLLYDGKWWLHPDYRFNYAAFQPKQMTADELTDYVFYMRKKFNSVPIILKRVFSWHNLRNIGRILFLLRMMFLYRRETFKKQGMKFGVKSQLTNSTI